MAEVTALDCESASSLCVAGAGRGRTEDVRSGRC